MQIIIDAFTQSYISLIANVGLLAILAWFIAYFDFNLTSRPSQKEFSISVKTGLLFGAAAALLINMPIQFAPGIIADARGAPLLMAGIIGGPISAAITATIAASVRFYVGGIGMAAGVSYIIVFAGIGVAWRWYCHHEKKEVIAPLSLIAVATFATAVTMPTILTFPAHVQYSVLVGVWPQLWIANILGIWMFSQLIARENERRQYSERLKLEAEKASRSARAKAKFLTAMSHEIRTPLNGILGIIQIVLRNDLPQKIDKELRIARESGFFLLGLLNQVLDFAKIEAGKSVITKQDFNVETLVDGLNSIFHFQLQNKGLEFKVEVSEEAEGYFHGDLDHIQQILFNLIGNATKFTKHGFVKLEVDIKSKRSQSALVFNVIDTGPGIPHEKLEAIFEEFEQVEGRPQLGGSGLGLSIARGLCEDMGGSLNVESTPGVGSKFIATIPVEEAKNEKEGEIGPTRSSKVMSKTLSVLVAEDNSVNQMVIQGLLEDSGHNVTIANDGVEVVERITTAPESYDLILMDVQMPNMTGVDATKAIRATPLVPRELPIIALTANAFIDQRTEYIDAGMNDVLIKPVRLSELNEILARYFGEYAKVSKLAESHPVPDHSELNRFCERMGVDGVHNLLEKANQNARKIFGEIRSTDKNDEELDDLLHELKGMLSNFGFHASLHHIEALRSDIPSKNRLDAELSILEKDIKHNFKAAFTHVSNYTPAQKDKKTDNRR